MKIIYLSLAALLMLTNLSTVVTAAPYQLYLTRHAHKADAGKDPKLSACGQAQAVALATLLAPTAIKALYHTPFQRTKQTAEAMLTQGRSLYSYPAADIAALATQLQQQQQNALVVGHSNTIPQLAALLSAEPQAELTEQDYGAIYQLQFDGGRFISLTKLQLPAPAICQPMSAQTTPQG